MALSSDSVDVVVVGSGAGGAPMAYELARAGAKVVVLEKGRSLPMEAMVHDEITMCRRNTFVPYIADEPHTIRTGPKGKTTRTTDGWISCIVGGGTVHMSGYFLRMQPVDFRTKGLLGHVPGTTVADWPIKYADLEPYYTRAERELGVSGRWKSHPFEEPRSEDYPLPPLLEHPIAQRIDAAAAAVGMSSFPTPRAIVSQPYRGRAQCMYCPLCGSYGCEVGAKSSTAVSLLPAAEKTGRCEIRPLSMAVEIPVDRQGRATGVVYRNTETGQTTLLKARYVVVACSAIESARLLLRSTSSRFPRGLGNGSGLIGKNLQFSGLGKGRAVFNRKKNPWLEHAAPFAQRCIQDHYLRKDAADGIFKGGTILFEFAHPNPIYTAERLAGGGMSAIWGKALKKKLRDEAAGARTLEFETFTEYLPNEGTYVDLDDAVKDRWGDPVARLNMDVFPWNRMATGVLVSAGMKVLHGLGADSIDSPDTPPETRVLQAGTCRFGERPEESVLNTECRMHEVPNVYVSDGSFMPSSGAVPVTLTILANSFRVAEGLVRRVKQGHP